MARATTNVIIFKPPVYKTYPNLTVEEKNTNLEYFCDLLTEYTDLEVFDNLTDINETYGNAYYLGYHNASHASLCVFYPHASFSGNYTGVVCLELVDSQNLPIASGSKYSRTNTDAYGYCPNIGYYNRLSDYWAFVVTKNEDATYIQFFGVLGKGDAYTGATTPVSAINTVLYNTEYGMISTGTDYLRCVPGFWMSKTVPYYLRYYISNREIYIQDSPINEHGSTDVLWPGQGLNMSEVCRYYADMEKKYYVDKITLKNSNNIPYDLEYPTNSPFKGLFGFNFDNVTSGIKHNTIFKMDNKYYLAIRKYNNATICAWEIGDQWEQITVVL